MDRIRSGGLVCILLALFSTGAVQAAGLTYQLGDTGISNLTYNGQVLIKEGGLAIDHAIFRRADGSTYTLPGAAAGWLPRAGNTVTKKEAWGQVTCTFAPVGDGVRMDFTILNSTTDTLASCEILTQSLTIPNLGEARFWRFDPGMFYANDNPEQGAGYWSSGNGYAIPVVQCEYATGCVALAQSAFPEQPVEAWGFDTNTCVVLQNPPGYGALFCKVLLGGIGAGQSQSRQFSLRFAPTGTDPYAAGNYLSDIYEKYNAYKPMRLQWGDHRPIGQDCVFPAQGNAATPQNPRRFTTPQDLRTAVGQAAFRAELLKRADWEITFLKAAHAQGVIFWCTEGVEEFNVMYEGDPTRVTQAPEMEYKGTSTVATVDAFFKKFTDAGLRIGQCLRPQIIVPMQFELGTQFKPLVNGAVKRLRVYGTWKEGNAVHTARLWRNSDKTVIGGPYSWTYGGTNGWVELEIPDVPVTAQTEYTVSVSTGATVPGHPWFNRKVADSWLSNGSNLSYRTRGVATDKLGTLPTNVWSDNEYLRDVVFTPSANTETLYPATALPTEATKCLTHIYIPDPAQHLIDMITYCKNRWGSTLFYVDSSMDAAGPLKGDVWYRVQAAHPDVLVLPENQCAEDYASGAPLDWPGHGVHQTPRKVRVIWPAAFTTLLDFAGSGFVSNAIPLYVEGIRQGTIPLIQPGNTVAASIWEQAGSLPSVRITGPTNDTRYAAGASIVIAADAADRDGTVRKVEFYYSTIAGGRVYLGACLKPSGTGVSPVQSENGGVNGRDARSTSLPRTGETPVPLTEATTSALYRFTWKNPPVGRYVLSARAIDNAGLDAWSGQVVVNVLSAGGTPFFSPMAGTYRLSQAVTIRSAADGATIRYTTDGSTPGASHGNVYAGPIEISSHTILKARAYQNGKSAGPVATAAYAIQCAQPTFAPWAGWYDSTQSVAITSGTVGATIRYTIDGSLPSPSHGTVYTAPVAIGATTALKALAYKKGRPASPPTAGSYTIIGPELVNGSFETPSLSGFQYSPTWAIWTFTGMSGIQRTGSGWTPTTAPDGVQTAFLQGASGRTGKIAQTVNLAAGTYAVAFEAAQRSAQIQPIKVTMDGAPVGSAIAPTSTNFTGYTSATFTVTAGHHTLALESTDASGDKSSLIDQVTIKSSPDAR